MIRTFSRQASGADPALGVLAAALAGAGASVLWASQTVGAKGVSGIIEVAAALLAPVAAWLAWARPLIFPYGLYAIVAPLDVLTSLSKQDGTIARLLGLVSAAALVFYIVRTRTMRAPPRAVVCLGLFCGWMALSTLWSVGNDPGKETLTLLQIAGLYLAVALFPTRRRDLIPLLAMLLIGGVVAAGIGIYEFRASGAEAQALQDYHRISVTLGQAQLDPNMYADSLLLPFAIALAWFVRVRKPLTSIAALIAMGTMVFAIALAGSRDATVGLGIVTIMLTTTLRAWKRVALPVGALICGTLAMFPNAIMRALADNGQGYGRTSIWHVAYAAFVQHPLVGWGAGSFGAVYDHWYIKVFEKYDVGWDMASHDLVVHYGVEFGLIGLILVFAWGLSQWSLARALPRTGLLGDIRAICLASLGALTFAAFFIDLFDVKFVWFVFALIVQTRNAALGGDA
jgi:O-antigen ligase